MKLSLIIAYTHSVDVGRLNGLTKLIESIQSQSYKNFETIVVEDTQGRDKPLFPFSNKVNKVITISDPEGRKFNKSWVMNVGARVSTTENLLFVDADVIFGQDFLQKVTNYAPRKKLFNCWSEYHIMPGRDNPDKRTHYFPTTFKALVAVFYSTKDFFFNELGGYNEDYFGYGGEDNDIYTRSQFLLGEIPTMPYSLEHTYHDWHPSNSAMPLSSRRMEILNKTLANPLEIINKLKKTEIGNLRYPTLIGESMYSQYGEDTIMFKYLTKEPQLYIDIGAGDPSEYSNTLKLSKLGWSGLLVEPSPRFIPKLKEQRQNTPIYEGAILDYDGHVQLSFKEDMGVVDKSWLYYDYKTEVIKEYANKWEGQVVEVPCLTFENLLKKYPKFKNAEFVSIDVEGTEEFVLKGVDFKTFKPKLICIEWTIRHRDQRPEWEYLLLPYYNFVEKTDGNAFYTRKQEGGEVVLDGVIDIMGGSNLSEIRFNFPISNYSKDHFQNKLKLIKESLLDGGRLVVEFPNIPEIINTYYEKETDKCMFFLSNTMWGYSEESFTQLLGDGWEHIYSGNYTKHKYPKFEVIAVRKR